MYHVLETKPKFRWLMVGFKDNWAHEHKWPLLFFPPINRQLIVLETWLTFQNKKYLTRKGQQENGHSSVKLRKRIMSLSHPWGVQHFHVHPLYLQARQHWKTMFLPRQATHSTTSHSRCSCSATVISKQLLLQHRVR